MSAGFRTYIVGEYAAIWADGISKLHRLMYVSNWRVLHIDGFDWNPATVGAWETPRMKTTFRFAMRAA